MKKFLPYLLITIISIGFLTPTLQIQAQTNYADCILKNGEGASECDTFPGSPKSVEAEKKAAKPVEDVNNAYHLLQPLACEPGPDNPNCVDEDKDGVKDGVYALSTFDPSGQGKLGIYLNFAIKLFIALCAVAAVVMITIGGIEWAGSELISKKEDGKQRIWQAVLGLVLALSSYLILYTINPDLLNTDVDVGGASVESEGQQFVNDLKEFVASGVQTIDGKPVKVNFKKDACPAALAAEKATGVKAAFLFAIYQKETTSGSFFGGCNSNNDSCVRWRPGTDDKNKLNKILASIGKSGSVVKVSGGGGAGGGNGGCMGHMQVCPSEWIRNGGLGKNPWNVNDAMMVAANLLVNEKGYRKNPELAACGYFGACSYGSNNYNTIVLGSAKSFQKKIDAGECNP